MKPIRVLRIILLALFVSQVHATPLSFDPKQLDGVWADSLDNAAVCRPENPHFRYEFSADGKRISIVYDRKFSTSLGDNQKQYGASILKATANTLVIRYDDEDRRSDDGKLVEWELAVVGPGIYRWRATVWPEHEVNKVVGIRCSSS